MKHSVTSLYLSIFFALLVFTGTTAFSQEQPESEQESEQQNEKEEAYPDVPENIKQLIKQLGAKEMKKRQNAEDKLREKGEPIRPHLKKFRDHSNPEIRSRVQELIKYLNRKRRQKRVENGPPVTVPKVEWAATDLISHLRERTDIPFAEPGGVLEEEQVKLSGVSLSFWNFMKEFCRQTDTRFVIKSTDEEHLISFRNGSLSDVPHSIVGSMMVQVVELNANYGRSFPAGEESGETKQNKMRVELRVIMDPRISVKELDDVKVTGAKTNNGEVLPPINEKEDNSSGGMAVRIRQAFGRNGQSSPPFSFEKSVKIKSPQEGGRLIKNFFGKLTVNAIAHRKPFSFSLSSPDDVAGSYKKGKKFNVGLKSWDKKENSSTFQVELKESDADSAGGGSARRRAIRRIKRMRKGGANQLSRFSFKLDLPSEGTVELTEVQEVDVNKENRKRTSITATIKYSGKVPEGTELIVVCPNQEHEWTPSFEVENIPLPRTNRPAEQTKTEEESDQGSEKEQSSGEEK